MNYNKMYHYTPSIIVNKQSQPTGIKSDLLIIKIHIGHKTQSNQ